MHPLSFMYRMIIIKKMKLTPCSLFHVLNQILMGIDAPLLILRHSLFLFIYFVFILSGVWWWSSVQVKKWDIKGSIIHTMNHITLMTSLIEHHRRVKEIIPQGALSLVAWAHDKKVTFHKDFAERLINDVYVPRCPHFPKARGGSSEW